MGFPIFRIDSVAQICDFLPFAVVIHPGSVQITIPKAVLSPTLDEENIFTVAADEWGTLVVLRVDFSTVVECPAPAVWLAIRKPEIIALDVAFVCRPISRKKQSVLEKEHCEVVVGRIHLFTKVVSYDAVVVHNQIGSYAAAGG